MLGDPIQLAYVVKKYALMQPSHLKLPIWKARRYLAPINGNQTCLKDKKVISINMIV
jgi:hypothetical protein